MNKTIYLSGSMMAHGKENFELSNYWRIKAKEYFDQFYYGHFKTFNPNDYWSFNDEEITYSSDKEVMEFDLYRLRNSDIVLVYFNAPSQGTMAELAIAYELKKPIIGIHPKCDEDDPEHYELHPWEKCFCNRIFDNMFEAFEYIGMYYS